MTAATWIPEETFGDRINLLRRRKKITTREMAEVLGCSQKAIVYWEHGSVPKNMRQIVLKLSNEYHVDPIWLMWGESRPVGLAGLEPATERSWVSDSLALLTV